MERSAGKRSAELNEIRASQGNGGRIRIGDRLYTAERYPVKRFRFDAEGNATPYIDYIHLDVTPQRVSKEVTPRAQPTPAEMIQLAREQTMRNARDILEHMERIFGRAGSPVGSWLK